MFTVCFSLFLLLLFLVGLSINLLKKVPILMQEETARLIGIHVNLGRCIQLLIDDQLEPSLELLLEGSCIAPF